MPNNAYDDLFDRWGQALNVNPQLLKTIFQMESSGDPSKPHGGMGISDDVAATIATRMGWDPKQVDVRDMRWAVPIASRILADGLNATGSPEGALGYYNTGQTDPGKWNQGYISQATSLYPGMTLTPARDEHTGDNIVTTATGHLGQTSSTIGDFLHRNNEQLDPTRANWCAAFVNSALNENGVAGVTGAGRDVATSFLKWGTPVDGAPQAGDVLVEPRGHPAGGLGGHVGFATGHVASGPNGDFYLMESGNLNGKVAYSWEPAQGLVVRRAPPPLDQSQPPAAPDQSQSPAPPDQPQQQASAPEQ